MLSDTILCNIGSPHCCALSFASMIFHFDDMACLKVNTKFCLMPDSIVELLNNKAMRCPLTQAGGSLEFFLQKPF